MQIFRNYVLKKVRIITGDEQINEIHTLKEIFVEFFLEQRNGMSSRGKRRHRVNILELNSDHVNHSNMKFQLNQYDLISCLRQMLQDERQYIQYMCKVSKYKEEQIHRLVQIFIKNISDQVDDYPNFGKRKSSIHRLSAYKHFSQSMLPMRLQTMKELSPMPTLANDDKKGLQNDSFDSSSSIDKT